MTKTSRRRRRESTLALRSNYSSRHVIQREDSHVASPVKKREREEVCSLCCFDLLSKFVETESH